MIDIAVEAGSGESHMKRRMSAYESDDFVVVYYNLIRCNHAEEYVRGLPMAFNVEAGSADQRGCDGRVESEQMRGEDLGPTRTRLRLNTDVQSPPLSSGQLSVDL